MNKFNDLSDILADNVRIQARIDKKAKLRKNPSRFGQSEFFRRYKRVKIKYATRREPPTLVENDPFLDESRDPPDNRTEHKSTYRRPIASDLM